MSINWSGWHAELATNGGAAIPAVLPPSGGGIWETNEIERVSHTRIPKFPILVYKVEDAPSADWGLTNSAFEARVTFSVIDRQPAGLALTRGLKGVTDQADALRARLLHTGNVTTATVLDVEDVQTEPPALAFLYERNIPFVAASISAVFVIGETIS